MQKLFTLSFSAVFLTACGPMPMDHLGCQESEIVDVKCIVAEEGTQNIDLFTDLASLSVQGSKVNYMENVQGYLAQPEAEGTYPGVIMIHEWWGLNENIEDMARLLAHEGYVVLAVDIYEGSVAENSDQARVLAGTARENTEKSVANMQAAIDYLQTLPAVEDQSIGSMGWCFGGQQSLNISRTSEDLDATVIYYGNLETEAAKLQTLKGPVLGIFGAEDTGIPVESVQAFEAGLDQLGIENNIYIYPGVGHAFANPSGSRYAPEETVDAWEKTVNFLNQNLKK